MCSVGVSGSRILSGRDVKGGLGHKHRTACLESAIQVEFVSLIYVEVPLEGFRGPPTDVVFENAINERFVLQQRT
jgi:hypothetical protein